jgi:hypothetical protein
VSVIAAELARARLDEHVMDMLGRAIPRACRHLVGDDDPEEVRALAREAVYEARRGAVAGLVSDPTTQSRVVSRVRSASISRDRASALREHRSLVDPATDAGRIAKLRRAVGFSARAHVVGDWVRPDDRCVMVTLTYAGTNADWQPNHVRDFLTRVRNWLARRDVRFRYVWVAELQKRGVIHYHVALWLPAGVDLPKPDQAGWWTHGMTRIETARAAVPYLMKYLSKGGDASRYRLPKGARSYGVGGLEHTMRRARRWLGLPSFVRARSDIHGEWKRAQGGGWIDPHGEIWASEYRRVFAGDRYALERVLDHGRPFEADGPFCWVRQ